MNEFNGSLLHILPSDHSDYNTKLLPQIIKIKVTKMRENFF